jgi:hypothetical protein
MHRVVEFTPAVINPSLRPLEVFFIIVALAQQGVALGFFLVVRSDQ